MAGVNDNLIPPKKGEVRNPKGRGKGVPNSKTRLLRLLELTQNLENPVTGDVEGFSVMEQIDMQLIQKARSGELAAIRELLDRLEGKPGQAMDITSGGEKLPTVIIESTYGAEPKFRVDNSVSKTDDVATDSSTASS